MLTILLTMLTIQPAHAFNKKVGAQFCASPFEISDQILECDGNDLYLQEGEKCLDRLDAEEKSLAALLPANGFSANTDEKQKGKFASSSQDYRTASAALAYLIATEKVAEGEILAYKFSLKWPEDIDEPEVTQGDELGYAMSVDCYGTNRENLESLLEDFQARRKRYEAIKQVADANAGISDKNRGNLDVTSEAGLKAVNGGKGAGSGVKSGKSKNGASDITGVKQDEEKRK